MERSKAQDFDPLIDEREETRSIFLFPSRQAKNSSPSTGSCAAAATVTSHRCAARSCRSVLGTTGPSGGRWQKFVGERENVDKERCGELEKLGWTSVSCSMSLCFPDASCLSVTLSLSLCFSVSLYLCLSLPLSCCFSVSLSLCLSVSLPHFTPAHWQLMSFFLRSLLPIRPVIYPPSPDSNSPRSRKQLHYVHLGERGGIEGTERDGRV